jgi:prephenate dehydratase
MKEETISRRVAFQGAPGAFSEEAAVKLLGEQITLVARPTFESLFAAPAEGVADWIIVPIENTLAGSIQRSYDLLLESPFRISGEVILRISHCLIGCTGASFESIRFVESHSVALSQCERFFSTHPQVRRIVSEDTAGSVAQIVKALDTSRAAIAGKRAVEIYGGTILLERLEDYPENYTRFLLLTDSSDPTHEADKLSLVLKLPHQPAALHHALGPFARRGIDLLKIETRPIKDHPWEYHFCLDLRGSLKDVGVMDAVDELKSYGLEVRLLGCYVSANQLETRKLEKD